MHALVAAQLGTPDQLVWQEVPPKAPAAGEVVVAVHTAAINYPDLLMIAGKYQTRPELPFVPGREGCGTVTACGPGVTTPRVGSRVMFQLEFGAFAEAAVVPADSCYPVPDGVSDEAAAALGVAFQTAHFAWFRRAQLQPGETVLVSGASSSVGRAAIQLARAHGCRVLAGLTTKEKAAFLGDAGIAGTVDLSAEPPRDRIREQVAALTGGGVDAVMDMVGGEVFTGCLRALAFEGRLVVVGFTSGVIPELAANYALLKNIAVLGMNWTAYTRSQPERVRAVQADLFARLLRGELDAGVQEVFPMENPGAAFALIARRGTHGKLVLRTSA